MFPERIETERLVCRKPVTADGNPWARIMQAPEIDEAAWPAHQRTPDRIRAVAGRTIGHWDAHGFGAWTVLEGDEVVGRVGLAISLKEGTPAVEVGWWIEASRWGRGYATEIAARAVELGRDELGLATIHAWTTPANVASQRIMAKLGLEHAGNAMFAGLPHLVFTRDL